MEIKLKIDGMGCAHCIKSVKEALEALEDIKILELKLGEARIELPEHYDIEKIKNALDDAGYDVL